MRIDGIWFFCDDGVARPIFWAEVQAADGHWLKAPFLADCGADRTVLSGNVINGLSLIVFEDESALSGIGGTAPSGVCDTRIRMPNSAGTPISFHGQFSTVLDSDYLDMSLLGRDITNNFALIIDRPSSTVCLLSRGETYQA